MLFISGLTVRLNCSKDWGQRYCYVHGMRPGAEKGQKRTGITEDIIFNVLHDQRTTNSWLSRYSWLQFTRTQTHRGKELTVLKIWREKHQDTNWLSRKVSNLWFFDGLTCRNSYAYNVWLHFKHQKTWFGTYQMNFELSKPSIGFEDVIRVFTCMKMGWGHKIDCVNLYSGNQSLTDRQASG